VSRGGNIKPVEDAGISIGTGKGIEDLSGRPYQGSSIGSQAVAYLRGRSPSWWGSQPAPATKAPLLESTFKMVK
jgi:hypothetical protein